jgi:Disulfide bond isomerase protein N-terminal domain
MTFRLLLVSVMVFTLQGVTSAEENKAADMDAAITKVVEKSLGKGPKIVRIEGAEKSRISGLKQIRVWFESPFGLTPILFYSTDDGKLYIAGSIYDPDGNNLTKIDVGKTIPKMVKESDMEPNHEYSVGPKDAKVRALLWVGTDPLSKIIFETFQSLYKNNKDRMSLSIKFYPKTERDYAKMTLVTCFKGEEAMDIYQKLLDTVAGWGSDEDIEAFKEKHGVKGKECNRELIKKDIELSRKLMLPQQPVVFINGTMLIEEQSKENISKLAGVQLE